MQRKWNNNYNERMNEYQKRLKYKFTDKPIVIISLVKRFYPYESVKLQRQVGNFNKMIYIDLEWVADQLDNSISTYGNS